MVDIILKKYITIKSIIVRADISFLNTHQLFKGRLQS